MFILNYFSRTEEAGSCFMKYQVFFLPSLLISFSIIFLHYYFSYCRENYFAEIFLLASFSKRNHAICLALPTSYSLKYSYFCSCTHSFLYFATCFSIAVWPSAQAFNRMSCSRWNFCQGLMWRRRPKWDWVGSKTVTSDEISKSN